MVELTKAAELLILAQDAVNQHENPETPVVQADLEQIAEMLSTLGLCGTGAIRQAEQGRDSTPCCAGCGAMSKSRYRRRLPSR